MSYLFNEQKTSLFPFAEFPILTTVWVFVQNPHNKHLFNRFSLPNFQTHLSIFTKTWKAFGFWQQLLEWNYLYFLISQPLSLMIGLIIEKLGPFKSKARWMTHSTTGLQDKYEKDTHACRFSHIYVSAGHHFQLPQSEYDNWFSNPMVLRALRATPVATCQKILFHRREKDSFSISSNAPSLRRAT